jgi:ABC-type amino acid transport substrate-binding protein
MRIDLKSLKPAFRRTTRIAGSLAVLAPLVLASACVPETPTAAPPTAAATTAPGAATPPALPATPVSSEDLDRVLGAGLLAAGSSLDNPPFSYYNDHFQADGFDIALIQAIGTQLGVQTTIRDLAFDGLGSALDLGQMDLAIAAITVSPERAAQVDFSTPYFQSRSAVLARSDSPIDAIDTADDLAVYRIGVQQGTIYETWVNDTLIDTGKLPAGNLFLYPDPGTAVRDLIGNSMDVVMLDALPAQSFVGQGGVKLVRQGLISQEYAIALRKGSSLLEAVNRALATLVADGTVAELTDRYLELEQHELDAAATEAAAATSTPIPSVTPLPADTATSPPPTEPPAVPAPTPCPYGLTVVQHLSFDDQDMHNPPELSPGQAFTKGWRVQNIGTCAWTTAYRVVYVMGNTAESRMGGQPQNLTRTVPPGDTYDININMVAPTSPGIYMATWQMVNADGLAFGERLPVGIQVVADPAVPTATIAPTETPVPGITFTASATQVTRGSLVDFTWNAPGATEVYFYAETQSWQRNPVGSSGTATVQVFQTTVYKLRVVQADGTVAIQSIVIHVI